MEDGVSGGNAEGVMSNCGGWMMELVVALGCGSLIVVVDPGTASPCLFEEEGLAPGELEVSVDGGKSAVRGGENKNSRERSFEFFIITEIASSIGASFAL